ncbi:MAG TPA: T9SS type A sorting domain-containing protein [Ignavibacteria bacterium]|nr:hypothetical protein [Bacteroidota bacterium]HRI86219.1 T9SS type A sorting domain-containing protein [Ignavibacteria bacterium]HRK00131.1 T9SS type A sorting domain-containing protein [Ignavibacteria bacterium]
MSKIIIIAVITFLTTVSASSQLVFERIGGDTTYGNSDANYAYAYYKNNGSSPVNVRFNRTQDILPNPFWTSSICVGLCYAPFVHVVPDTSAISGPEPPVTIMPGEQDTMDITFYSPNTGIAHIKLRIYVDENPSEFIERDFILNVTSVGINNISSLAESYSLSQNYPNPFNPNTSIEFSITKSDMVTLKVFDILGNEVSSPVSNERLNAGSYKVDFNGNNLSSGIYYYTLSAGNFRETKKMMLVK